MTKRRSSTRRRAAQLTAANLVAPPPWEPSVPKPHARCPLCEAAALAESNRRRRHSTVEYFGRTLHYVSGSYVGPCTAVEPPP